jgi:hypothetical protein
VSTTTIERISPTLRKRWGILGFPFGAKPDFIIIGAQKAGTTSLFEYLRSHPGLSLPHKKEIHYFDDNLHRGETWYRSHFPTRFRKFLNSSRDRTTLSGEATPYYLFHPLVPQRVHQLVPDARLIVLLRNPIDRAYSQYQLEVRAGFESLSFEDALAAEKDRLEDETEKLLADDRYISYVHKRFSYVTRGFYLQQILRWLEYFSRDQLLILRSEDFFENPYPILAEVVQFLGLDPWNPGKLTPYNQGGYSDIAPAVRQRLQTVFEPHNQHLFEFLGRDMGWCV